MTRPFSVGPTRDRECVRKACNKQRLCQYPHDCRSMAHEEMAIARATWAATEKARKEETEIREAEERREKHVRMLDCERRLDGLGIVLDDLVELIDARRNGEY